jgi:hypothetical protein
LTIKRISLTAFFIALTLCIGLESVNVPLTVTAQNNALSQSGNSDSEQETEQSQSSDQNGQVVSGDSSILSGNNLSCQDKQNSEAGLGLCPDGTIPPSSGTQTLHIHTTLFADCFPIGPECPSPDGRIKISLIQAPYEPATHQAGGQTDKYYEISTRAPYSIQVQGGDGGSNFSYEYADIQGDCSGRDSCNAVMGPAGAEVGVIFHYKSNSE